MSARSPTRLALTVAAFALATSCGAAPQALLPGDAASPLKLERIIPLPNVAGRIDHLAIDIPHHMLFIAEYANGTVDAVDLNAGQTAGRISGLHEPQGVAVLPDGQQLVVACGDGTVHFYATIDRHEIAQLSLGDDADNVRIDPRNGHVVVGYGGGGLAVIDPIAHKLLGRLVLPGHPEGFRLDGSKVFINVPDRGAILIGDLDSGRVIATLPTGMHKLNFPLTIDRAGQWFAVAYRLPAALELRATSDGKLRATGPACGDADDLFLDGDRIYLVCGAGHVDVASASHPEAQARRIATSPGARTGLFVPELKTLFVAAPARRGTAGIWVLRPN
jgi:DNA-binding beta-propeller fold protein YncE